MRIGLIGVGRIGVLHAATLRALPDVEALFVADADVALARSAADRLVPDHDQPAPGGSSPPKPVIAAGTVAELFATKPDGVVIAAATPAHGPLVRLAADAGVPTFCEKPLAPDVEGTRAILTQVAAAGIPLQMGFQRRFDAGYLAARSALNAGDLGRLHLVLACTLDPAPPHESYIPDSGGIFADCSVHDIDAVRWATGREVVEVRATGANKGADFFASAGDVDTASAVLTLDDGTLVLMAASRYNGAGYDVRLELHGSRATVVAGLDDQAPLASAEPDVAWPGEPAYANFAARFRSAYIAELRAFLDVAAGAVASPCPGEEALNALYVAKACELSRGEGRAVRVEEIVTEPAT
ncbi:MAG TPA: Gfo/Idh/MocA family oxidoreductase [Actinopolymorphaceae bacterium]|nr:Gfo/Idh/MocA family oxidoreductase [Actinopolymorphaceae bacterium]